MCALLGCQGRLWLVLIPVLEHRKTRPWNRRRHGGFNATKVGESFLRSVGKTRPEYVVGERERARAKEKINKQKRMRNKYHTGVATSTHVTNTHTPIMFIFMVAGALWLRAPGPSAQSAGLSSGVMYGEEELLTEFDLPRPRICGDAAPFCLDLFMSKHLSGSSRRNISCL